MRRFFPLEMRDLFLLFGVSTSVFSISSAVIGNPIYAVELAIGVFLLGLILWSISRLHRENETRFQLVSCKGGKEPKQTNTAIKKTQGSILVTHFTPSYPSPVYTAQMVEKLKKCKIVRIVGGKMADNPETDRWLDNFRGEPKYLEYKLRHDLKEYLLPFDFSIFDDKKVIIYFPASVQGEEFNQAIIINNEKVASIFVDIFKRLRDQSELAYEKGQHI